MKKFDRLFMVKDELVHAVFIDYKCYMLNDSMFDYSIIQLLDEYGINIPRFCYHESLSIAGNCRMCLVEVEGSVKPLIACATVLTMEMEIFTNSNLVKKSREGILEFLLINHPLDCPICDQGGECDLQDQTLLYGADRGRFDGLKRSVLDKNLGFFIKTIMTRCIHCTRCVRFMDEIDNNSNIGMFNRGNNSEISLYNGDILNSYLMGNIIDLCPVGALTSKLYAFKSRPWELTTVSSIDVLDSLGSNILINTKNNSIIRILPRFNSNINSYWISDKIRFIYDSINIERLKSPLIKDKNLGKHISCSWKNILKLIDHKLNKRDENKFFFFLGDNLDLFFLYKLKLLSYYKKKSYFIKKNNIENVDFLENYLVNVGTINDFCKNDTLYIILGNKLNEKLPIIWSYLLKNRNTNVLFIGPHIQSMVDYLHLGNSLRSMYMLFLGFSTYSYLFMSYMKIHVFNIDYGYNLNKINQYLNNILDINFQNVYSNVSDLNINYFNFNNTYYLKNNKIENNDFIWYINTYNSTRVSNDLNTFKIYQGNFFTLDAQSSDIVLPRNTFLEDLQYYINIFGDVQNTESSKYHNINDIKENDVLLKYLLHIKDYSKVDDFILWDVLKIKNVRFNYVYLKKIFFFDYYIKSNGMLSYSNNIFVYYSKTLTNFIRYKMIKTSNNFIA